MLAAAAITAAEGATPSALSLQTAEQVASFLTGKWSLRRRLRYSTGGATGSVTGSAVFAPAAVETGHPVAGDEKSVPPRMLRYSEAGLLSLDKSLPGLPAGGLQVSQRCACPPATRAVQSSAALARTCHLTVVVMGASTNMPVCGNSALKPACCQLSDALRCDRWPVAVHFVDPKVPEGEPADFFHELDFLMTPCSSAAVAKAAAAVKLADTYCGGGGSAGIAMPGDSAGSQSGVDRRCSVGSREPLIEVLAAAEFEHLCCADLYKGRLLVLGPSRFVWAWRIDGPQKAGEIDTVFDRVA